MSDRKCRDTGNGAISATDEAWLAVEIENFEGRIAEKLRGPDFSDAGYRIFEFFIMDIVIIAIRPELCEPLFDAVRKYSVRYTRLSLSCSCWNVMREMPESLRPTRGQGLLAARLIGEVLHSLPSLDNLFIEISAKIDLESSSLVGAMLRHCRRFDLLRVWYFDWGDYDWSENVAQCLETLMSSLDGRTSFQSVIITTAMPLDFWRIISRHVLTFKMLRRVTMEFEDSSFEGASNVIETVEDADILCSFLGLPLLEKMTMNGIVIGTDEAADTLCRGVAASYLQILYLENFSLPESKHAPLANALLASDLEELDVDGATGSLVLSGIDFFRALGHGLGASRRPRLQKLMVSLKSSKQAPIGTALLQCAKDWKLREFGLRGCREMWTDSFETALCEVVANNSHMITINVYGTAAPQPLPNRLLEAARLGKGNIDDINIVFGDQHFRWMRSLRHAVAMNLNRLKRVHGGPFQSVARVESKPFQRFLLVKALAGVDHVKRFAFLRDNFADCRYFLLEKESFPRRSSRKKRLRTKISSA